MEGDSIGGDLLDNLAALGVAPTDIDTVLFSHLHPDHVGWAADAGGEAVFPNAVNVLTEQELAFWFNNPEAAATGVAPDDAQAAVLKEQVRVVGDGDSRPHASSGPWRTERWARMPAAIPPTGGIPRPGRPAKRRNSPEKPVYLSRIGYAVCESATPRRSANPAWSCTMRNNRCEECGANNMDHWPWCSQYTPLRRCVPKLPATSIG
jgi:hypothetical protein